MSEERDPRSFLASALVLYGYGHEVAEKLVQQALDEHARELAEKQRQRLADEGYELGCVCGGCSCCLATEFIDLIDPKKEK